VSSGALEAVDRILNRGGEAEHVLDEVVRTLVERGGCTWAAIVYEDEGTPRLGPRAGNPPPRARTHVPIAYLGERVATLTVDGCADTAFLERVALLISRHCLDGRIA
jgi:hypothetical protein